MVRVLHVLGGLSMGGAESRIMDLYRNTDRNQVQFDFLVHMDAGEYARAVSDGVDPASYRKPQFYDEEIISLGGHIYALPRFRVYNLSSYRRAIHRFFEEHHDYNVVQGHMTSTASIYLPIAAQYRGAGYDHASGHAMVTVAHTRNAGVDAGLKGVIVRALRKSLPAKADFLFACSHLAGDETFGGAPYIYIPNTIDTERFRFDEADRDVIREKYGIPSDAVVIGNVARFSPQKNQKFLIRAFASAAIGGTDSAPARPVYLLLCGEGGLKDECEKLASELGVSDRVIFAGGQSEIEKYYSAMDLYAFPSVYEGLPGVVVEAQASGLKCLISDTITEDVCITDLVRRLPIDDPKRWCEALNTAISDRGGSAAADHESPASRSRYADICRDGGFDVHEQAGMMTEFYLDPCEATLPRNGA